MEINGKKCYPFLVEDIDNLVDTISLVDEPASDSDFIYFSKQDDEDLFKVFSTNEEQRKITGVILRANYPIYRKSIGEGEYRYFTPELIEQCILSASKNNLFNRIDLQHNGEHIDGVYMTQSFILDRDIDNISKGSWIGEYKIDNEDVWQKIKLGEYRGFSPKLPGISFKKEDDLMIEKLKQKVDKLFNKQFAKVETDKGFITYDELTEGAEVFIEDAEGNLITPEDGDYKFGNTTVTIMAGKITGIVEETQEMEATVEEVIDIEETAQVVEEVTEQVVEEIAMTGGVSQEAFDALVLRVDELLNKIATTEKEQTEFSKVDFVKEKEIKNGKATLVPTDYKWTKNKL